MTLKKGFALFKASTRAFLAEAREADGYGLFDLIHGYVYARWPYLYIAIGMGEHPLSKRLGGPWRAISRWVSPSKRGGGQPAGSEGDPPDRSDRPTFADTYHGKVVPLENAQQLVTVREEITLTDLERVIPYREARDIILHNPDHIVVLDCPCRSARDHPCLPLDVCLIIGEPFASFVQEHHPERSRWISSEEAVGILKAEDERGHAHHAFFKDAMLGRFYAICNCCSCCCGAMQAHRNGTPMLASSGYISKVDQTLCIACGICVETCPFGALTLDQHEVVVDPRACMGCGVCGACCPQGVISLCLEPSRGEPLDLHSLANGGRSGCGIPLVHS
jgi:ferredoxin